MVTLIPVTEHFTVQPLLPIENERFAWWYARGIFWALYGDQQGQGPCTDTYLLTNVTNNLRDGWYDDINSEHLHASGFYLGMIHGGTIDPVSLVQRSEDTIIRLTDIAFTSGYYAGCAEPRKLSDVLFMRLLHLYGTHHPFAQHLAYDLGVFIGSLSLKPLPTTVVSV